MEEGKQLKALKVRIYPNVSQKVLINKTLGCSRFLYNQMLSERLGVFDKLKEDRRELYEYKYKTEKEYKEEFDWLKEVDSTALQQSRMDLTTAYSNFFKSLKGQRKGQKVGYPKFKKKRSSCSYRTVMNLNIDYDKLKLKVPKLGWINFRHRNIKDWYKLGKIKNITISRSATGKYFASILIENEEDIKQKTLGNNPKVVGLDMSMDKFYVDNLGKSPEYKRTYRENEAKLAKAQRRLSRKPKGSKNRDKARVKVARVHEKITNERKDFVHKLSHDLIKNNDVIVVETLSLKGMSQCLNLGKSVMDLGYSEFVRQLQYKSKWEGKTLIEADKWFASSKLCSFCGFKKKDLGLSDREWVCPNCKTSHNRDTNAGINLRNYGLKQLGMECPKNTPLEIKTSQA